ncbi:hypothetical protein H6B10_17535, partial [Gemmiger formicilis]|uniref:hypothetical protein n=1 Tax=Gemmiger formicilis TaxID=745368 RepID=UPI00195A8827
VLRLAILHIGEFDLRQFGNAIHQKRHFRPEFLLDFRHRVKSIYGIYRKMYMQNKDFEEIYDIYAVRIILENV